MVVENGVTITKLTIKKGNIRLKGNAAITELAKENAISAISGLIEPWVNQVDDKYTVIIK